MNIYNFYRVYRLEKTPERVGRTASRATSYNRSLHEVQEKKSFSQTIRKKAISKTKTRERSICPITKWSKFFLILLQWKVAFYKNNFYYITKQKTPVTGFIHDSCIIYVVVSKRDFPSFMMHFVCFFLQIVLFLIFILFF